MSESLFLQRQINRFLAAHPREAGWEVYEFPSYTAQSIYLHHLLDYLRDWHPETLKSRTALPLVEGEVLRKALRQHDASSKGGSNYSLSEAESSSWRGSVELVWNGQDIHCQMFLLMMGRGCADVYLVATKSLAALHDLFLDLDRYGKTRHKEKTREILVINGDAIPVTASSWDDLVLPAQMARDIRTNVEGFFASPARYAYLGIPHRRGFLFTGPPGCGKTLMLKTLASNTSAKFISVLGTADVDDDMLRKALDLAQAYTPAVVLLEDLDRIIQAPQVSLSHFLNLMDGLKILNGVLVIATCNEPDKLDPALIHRPSRFDRVWRFELPKYEQRLELLRRKGGTFFSESALEATARRSEGFSMAYVQEIVVSALLECTHDEIEPHDDHLFKSLDTLRLQRKEASKPGESMEERESVGFCGSRNGSQ